jgi:transcriptional antiterminator NusG
MSENVKRWYVLRTIGGKEKKVKEYIENEIANAGLQEYVSQVLIPTERFIKSGTEKNQQGTELLPRICLVEACLVGEIAHILRNVTNVIGFLGDTKGGDPVPMRQSEVNRILGRVDEMAESAEEINIPYVVGETVKVIDGPFNGFNGIIEHINEKEEVAGYGQNFWTKNSFGTKLHAGREGVIIFYLIIMAKEMLDLLNYK